MDIITEKPGFYFKEDYRLEKKAGPNIPRFFTGAYRRRIFNDDLEIEYQEVPFYALSNFADIDFKSDTGNSFIEYPEIGPLRIMTKDRLYPRDEATYQNLDNLINFNLLLNETLAGNGEVSGFFYEDTLYFSFEAKSHTEMLSAFMLDYSEVDLFSIRKSNHTDSVNGIEGILTIDNLEDAFKFDTLINSLFLDWSRYERMRNVTGIYLRVVEWNKLSLAQEYDYDFTINLRLPDGQIVTRSFVSFNAFFDSIGDSFWESVDPSQFFDIKNRAIVAWIDKQAKVHIRSGGSHPGIALTSGKEYTEDNIEAVVSKLDDGTNLITIQLIFEDNFKFSEWFSALCKELIKLGVSLEDRISYNDNRQKLQNVVSIN